jgi:SAM-dependent methyltransferase
LGVFAVTGWLRDAVWRAADELGIMAALARAPGCPPPQLAAAVGLPLTRRLVALLDALVALGLCAREGAGLVARAAGAPVGELPRAGWGLLADVVRRDVPLPVDAADQDRYHRHLLVAGEAAAREVAGALGPGPLVDLGGGAGAYAAAFLDARPGAEVTLVDAAAPVALAVAHLARFGRRVRFVVGDALADPAGGGFGAALLANVLHLHGEATCAALCAAAARAVEPGGLVAVTDLRIESDRASPLAGALFALNMAVYTDAGSVYEVSQIGAWLAQAGLVAIEARALAAEPDAVLVWARRPAARAISAPRAAGEAGAADGASPAEAGEAGAADGASLAEAVGDGVAVAAELDARMAAATATAWRGAGRADPPPAARWPRPLRAAVARAVAEERAAGTAEAIARADALADHYAEHMPRARAAALADRRGPAAILHHRVAWSRLPRLAAAIDRLYAVLAAAGVDPVLALGEPTAEALRAASPTLAALYARAHYAGAMPLLYGAPADLAYVQARAAAASAGGVAPAAAIDAAIDRYLAAPLVHELCHFGPDRAALAPIHLDECVAGWLGVHVHPELAYPALDPPWPRDGEGPAPAAADAIFAAPWLAQIGQAIARAFGLAAVVRAQAGAIAWPAAVPAAFVAAAARLGRADYLARRPLHLLADARDPAPWVALALAAGAGLPVAGLSSGALAQLPAAAFSALADDPRFDRAITEDALRAMCLRTALVAGTLRTVAELPEPPITVDAGAGWAARPAAPGALELAPPRYWIPPAVCARLGGGRSRVQLGALAAIPEAAAALCAGATACERPGFAIAPERGDRGDRGDRSDRGGAAAG